MILFLQHHFFHKIFCITIVCVTNVCTFILDSKETTHAKINVQNFVTQKMLMQKFLLQKKTRAKINRQNYDYLVRVLNDRGLESCRREGAGE